MRSGARVGGAATMWSGGDGGGRPATVGSGGNGGAEREGGAERGDPVGGGSGGKVVSADNGGVGRRRWCRTATMGARAKREESESTHFYQIFVNFLFLYYTTLRAQNQGVFQTTQSKNVRSCLAWRRAGYLYVNNVRAGDVYGHSMEHLMTRTRWRKMSDSVVWCRIAWLFISSGEI